MNALIAWWARNGVASNLLMIAIIITGVLSFSRIQREVFPSASFNDALVSVVWPGASPREIEQQIILRIEEAVSDVDGIDHVEATAREGRAQVTVYGKDNIDTTRFLNDIKNRVDGISTLPPDSYPPVVQQLRNQNMAIAVALYGDLDEKELNRLALKLRDEVSQLPNGSPLVELWGDRREQVSIEISEEAMRRYGLTFDDIARAVRGSSLNLAGGEVRTDTGNVQVATRNLADTESDFEKIVVRQLPDGSVIHVGDVAKVIDGFEDVKQKREMNGKPSITIAVMAPETLNIVELSKSVNNWVKKKNKELAGKATLTVWFDTADLYYARMHLVSSNAISGLVLVLIILLLFLRPVVAFWVTGGILVSVVGAFIFMPATGVSLNMLSLFAFLLVVGILCDDAIVVGENIHNEVEAGGKGVDAAIVGTQLVAKPVLFAVLTTIIAFLPWLFMSGGTSQFTKHISLTIVYALSFSLIEAFFILPSHLAHLKKQYKEGVIYRLQSFFADGIVTVAHKIYKPMIEMALHAKYFTVAIFLGAFAVAVALLAQGWVGFKFMPEVQGTFISLSVRLPEGAPFSRSLQIFDSVHDAAYKMKKELGKVKDGEDYVKNIYVRANEGEVTSYVTIVDSDKRKESTEQIAQRFRDTLGDIPDAEEINVNYTISDNGPDLSFGVDSDSLEDLRLATLDIQNYIRTLPGVYDVRNSLQAATPELRLELKPGAERFGLTLADVARQVRQAFYGEEAQRLPRNGQDVRVMIRYPESARTSLASIDTMRIRTADGREVPLSAVADAHFEPSYKRIERRDRRRTAMVTGYVRDGVDRAALTKAFYDKFVPEWRQRHPNVSLSQRGDQEEQAKFVVEFLTLYAVAIFAMYMLIAIGFGSYWEPILIMSAIPFGFMGAAFGHFLLHLDFALFSFFGVGAAAGVVVNDNLVLLDYVNRLRKQGEGAFSALVKAGVGRFRPIFLTSVTTFFGLAPMMLARSTDAQFLMPTVVALAWGVFFALFVTWFFVPCMYAVGVDIARFYRWAWTGEKQPALGEGASRRSDLETPSFGPAE
ncbi:MAG: AcrB/AcrD/AcrF family protein [Alphaproteobacteria bacterium]|nr:AcrB/AcrD/AcrF family protein [Alphaproteobacteria bacterium]